MSRVYFKVLGQSGSLVFPPYAVRAMARLTPPRCVARNVCLENEYETFTLATSNAFVNGKLVYRAAIEDSFLPRAWFDFVLCEPRDLIR